MNLFNKNVLLLVPSFYGYEKEIERALLKMGASVTIINDQASKLFDTVVGVLKYLGVGCNWLVRLFENNIISKINTKKFNYIVVINGQYLTSHMISQVREKNLLKGGKMVLYYWDSLDIIKDDILRWSSFDGLFSFDYNDCLNHKGILHFLPLFYCDKYWTKGVAQQEYDLVTIGSFMLNRYEIINRIKERNPLLNIDSYLYISKWQIMFHKTFRHKYDKVKYDELMYKKMDVEAIMKYYLSSKAVLDISAEGQNGLTMRTFETLAMHRKLITTNQSVKEYDFYSPDNIFVIQGPDYLLPPKEWFDRSFSIPDAIIQKYSIDSWIRNIIKV